MITEYEYRMGAVWKGGGMAKQPIWTFHQGSAGWYARTSKADFCNALCYALRHYGGATTMEDMKTRINALIKAGEKQYGKQ